jgi:hypothetical protein
MACGGSAARRYIVVLFVTVLFVVASLYVS